MQVRALYERALDAADVTEGTRLLDVGCGAGGALGLAVQRGAATAGLDATPELLAIAAERVPDADLREGDLEELPWGDESFDVVTGFNSFQFAGDPLAALGEARRVARSGGSIVMATWGRPEDCEAAVYLQRAGALMPPPPPGAEGPFALSEPGKLEALVERAGLEVVGAEEVESVWSYADVDETVRGLGSAGPLVMAARHSGEEAVRQMIEGFARENADEGGAVRLRNVFRYILARA
jgi:SAM-dependent methyltransferase